MKRIILGICAFLAISVSAFAYDYGLHNGKVVDPFVVPQSTTMIRPNLSGATLYDKNGYSGRIYNNGSSRTTFSRNGGYQGTSYHMNNGGIRWVPAPTYRYSTPATTGHINHR